MLDTSKAECDIRLFFMIKKLGMDTIKEMVLERMREIGLANKNLKADPLKFNSLVEWEAVHLADNREMEYYTTIYNRIAPIYDSLGDVEQETLKRLYIYSGYLRNGRKADKAVSDELGIAVEFVRNVRFEFSKKVALEMQYFEIKLQA